MAFRNASKSECCTKESFNMKQESSESEPGSAAAAVQSPTLTPASTTVPPLRSEPFYCTFLHTHLIFRSLILFSLSRFLRISMNWLKKCSWSFRF